MRIGIDFGTTRTVVAGITDGNYPICSFEYGGRIREYIPTLAAAYGNKILYGWDAVQAVRKKKKAILFRGLKRLTSTSHPDELVKIGADISVPLIELLTGYFGYVRDTIVSRGNLHVNGEIEAMVATPANANSNQRYLTIEAFRRAGFNVLEVLNEPSVAALEYVHRFHSKPGGRSPKEYVVIYDLGGGTFDTAAVKFFDRSFEILGHDGIARFGGEDFDEILLEHALKSAGIDSKDISEEKRSQLLEECRERKEGLTPNTKKIAVDINVNSVDTTVVLDASALYGDCLPVIEPSIDAVNRVLDGLVRPGDPPDDPRRLAALYLVGGSVSFPPVSRRLREVFGRKVKHAPVAFGSTAAGLAIAADPAAGVRIQDSVSRYFGVWREADEGRDKLFDVLISKDTLLGPGQSSIVVRRYRPGHNIGHLRFMECSLLDETGQPAGDLYPWPEILFPYDPQIENTKNLAEVPIERRSDLSDQEIYETYRYDSDGILRVKIENRTSGFRRNFSLADGAIST